MLEPFADVLWIYGLSINNRSDQNWLNIQKIVTSQFPDLVEQMEPALFSKEHSYWAELRESLATRTAHCFMKNLGPSAIFHEKST